METRRLQRLNEASEWLLRLESGERGEEDINAWLRWCDTDPENVAAFESLQRDWHDLDALKGTRMTALAHSGLQADKGLVFTAEQKSALIEQENRRRLAKGRRLTRPFAGMKTAWAMAAALSVVALAAVLMYRDRVVPETSAQQVTSAVTGRVATLPDGSKMILGAKTSVDVDFNGAQRELDLSSGEAYFKVKHDKQHPFVVRAGEVSVTAVGTAFDVRHERDRVIVTVEEGIVDVAGHARGGKDTPTWRAEAGYQVTYSSRQRTATIASIDPLSALAWRNGELAYVREPLGSVIEDLNRYSTRKIVVEDPGISQLRFTGTAFTASLDDWLSAVQQAYPVEARETATGDVVLRARLNSALAPTAETDKVGVSRVKQK